MNARAGVLTPVSFVAIGLLLVIMASLAVFQTQGISVAPSGGDNGGLFEPKSGQISQFAPPYCNQSVFCLRIEAAIQRITALRAIFAVRFPFLVAVFTAIIARLQALQNRAVFFRFFSLN